MRFTPAEVASLIPVDHLSYSAVRDFIEDRRRFKKKWVDLIFDENKPMVFVEGIAYHAALEAYWQARKGGETDMVKLMELATNEAFSAITRDIPNTEWELIKIAAKEKDRYIKLGCEIVETTDKAGRAAVYAKNSPAVLEDKLRTILTQYISEPPAYDPMAVEISHTVLPKDFETKEPHLVTLKGKIDLVSVKDGKVTVVDHKLVGADPATDEETGELVVPASMRLQAAAYDTIICDILQANHIDPATPIKFVFDFMNKKTAKRTPVEIELTDEDRLAWSRLYKSVIMQLAFASAVDDWRLAFTPNPFAESYKMDGWTAFLEDLKSERPSEIKKVDPNKEAEYVEL
jgi:hypothetical protein